MTVRAQKAVRTLVEALPYIQRFPGTTMVVKYGGEMASAQLRAEFAADIALLKLVGMNPVVVHGGGPEVSRQMEKLGLTVDFVDGLRVTDAEAMDVVRMVLAGKVNKEIVGLIRAHGGTAVGLSGEDAGLIVAEPEKVTDDHGDPVELGHVGRVAHIDTTVLEVLASANMIPVVASIGVGTDGQVYNINADTVAGELAVTLQAEKIVFVSDLGGIVSAVELQDEEAHAVMRIISECTLAELDALQAAGGISGGMIPKVNAVRRALEGGVRSAHIIDGRVEHALLLEVLTDAGCGTKVSCDALGPALVSEASLYSSRRPVRGLSELSSIVARQSELLAAEQGSPRYQALVS